MALPVPNQNLAWPIAWDAVKLIANKEGLRLKAYKCSAGKWTCGWGETDGVGPNTRWTKEYADQRFCDSLKERADAVRNLITRQTNENELGALVSLSYNIGVNALAKSTVMRLHNKGESIGASRAFGLFNKFRNPATGKLEVSRGLESRRKSESALYLMPADDDEMAVDMPQEVAQESRLAQSPIAQGGAVTGTVGALGLMSSIGDQANQASGVIYSVQGIIGQVAQFIGFTPSQIGFCVLIGVGVWVAYTRFKQRAEGWA